MKRYSRIRESKLVGKNYSIDIYEPYVVQSPFPIVAIHGMWGTAKRWENYGRFFSNMGFRFIAPTLRHHFPNNNSVKELGNTSVNDYISDVAILIHALREYGIDNQEPLSPPIVFGHSMGGLITQKIAEAGLAKAVVLLNSAPPAGIKLHADWRYSFNILRYVPKMMFKKPFKPNRAIATHYIMNGMAPKDREEAYKNMVYESGKAALEIKFGKIAINFTKIKCPILLIGAEQDRIIPYQIAEDMAKKITHSDFDCWIYPNFAHWIPVENGWQEPAEHINNWLNRYL
jgi:pimeloyl-ACP methyl ester carboxylesterase